MTSVVNQLQSQVLYKSVVFRAHTLYMMPVEGPWSSAEAFRYMIISVVPE